MAILHWKQGLLCDKGCFMIFWSEKQPGKDDGLILSWLIDISRITNCKMTIPKTAPLY